MSTAMNDELYPNDKERLSSFLDQEGHQDSETRSLIENQFSAQLFFRNIETVHRATQQVAPPAASNDFLSRLMGAIDDVEQDDPAEDFEILSAWTDQEWDLPQTEISELSPNAQNSCAWMQTLGQAMRHLPTPTASADFMNNLMTAIDATQTPEFETVSALYDKETRFQSVRYIAEASHTSHTLTQLQNCKGLSKALKTLRTPSFSVDFTEKVMAALPAEALNLENLSAYHDHELNLELAAAPTLLKDFAQLSQAMQALPEITAPTDFTNKVMQAIDSLSQQSPLSAALQSLPEIQAPESFSAQVVHAIEANFETVSAVYDQESQAELSEVQQAQLGLLQSLSTGFAQLKDIQAPADFADKVMQRIDALPRFEELSAYHDGELQQAVNVSEEQMQPLRALSQALKALPQYEAPADFVAKVMLATEKHQKAKLFALPGMFKTRLGQVAAALALFGVLVLTNQIVQPFGTGTNVAVTENVVKVEYQAEDLLFGEPEISTVTDDTLELEKTPENDYTLWIGG